jgi:hypothetical protein
MSGIVIVILIYRRHKPIDIINETDRNMEKVHNEEILNLYFL